MGKAMSKLDAAGSGPLHGALDPFGQIVGNARRKACYARSVRSEALGPQQRVDQVNQQAGYNNGGE